MIHFLDDDEAYFAWIENHPGGFVVNCYRIPTPNYLALHRSVCKLIQQQPDKTLTCGDYQKVCADNEQELHDWAATINGVLTRGCTCRP